LADGDWPKKGNFHKSLKTLVLMNHYSKFINIWHGASLGPGDQDCSNEVPGVKHGRALRGHIFI